MFYCLMIDPAVPLFMFYLIYNYLIRLDFSDDFLPYNFLISISKNFKG